MADNLTYLSAARLAELLETRKLSSVELLQSCRFRKTAVDGRVKAFTSCDEAGALALAGLGAAFAARMRAPEASGRI